MFSALPLCAGLAAAELFASFGPVPAFAGVRYSADEGLPRATHPALGTPSGPQILHCMDQGKLCTMDQGIVSTARGKHILTCVLVTTGSYISSIFT